MTAFAAQLILLGLAGATPQQWARPLPDVTGYPRPTPVAAVARASEIPRLRVDPGGVEHARPGANEAVRIRVVGATIQPELFGARAPEGSAFLVLATRWENIHPKERVDRATLEGRRDRTMGVGAFAGGGGPAQEYVEVDVAYQVPRLADHVFALVDGSAMALAPATGTLPRGLDPDDALTLPELGSVAAVPLAFVVPASPGDIALQFFDYSYGNIVLPVRGDAERAAGTGEVAGPSVLDRAETDMLEVETLRLTFRDRYGDRTASDGWRFAVATLRGRSLSAGNIVELAPREYAFVITDGGYLRYAVDGSTDERGRIRFTPEVPQVQELAFLVPATVERMSLGLRVRNEVVTLRLTRDQPDGPPRRAAAEYRDGDVLEVTLYGIRREAEHWVADVGVRPVAEGRGLEVRPTAQFLLVTDRGEVQPDMAASEARAGAPPAPLVVPPGTPVRFELVYPGSGEATGLRYRGFRGEAVLER